VNSLKIYKMFVRPKIGLALSSGGARGFAHIGILKVLERERIPIDLVTGTSMGAIIGALHCAGLRAREIEEIFTRNHWAKLVDPKWPKEGLMGGDKIEALIRKAIKNKKFSDLEKPFAVVATDLNTGERIVLDEGNVTDAVRASISVPGILIPVKFGKKVLVDGNLVDPLPIGLLKNLGAKVVIASNAIKDLSIKSKTLRKKKGVPNIFDTIMKSIVIIENERVANTLEKNQPDLMIKPKLKEVSTMDYNKAKKIIKYGEREANRVIQEVKNLARPKLFRWLYRN